MKKSVLFDSVREEEFRIPQQDKQHFFKIRGRIRSRRPNGSTLQLFSEQPSHFSENNIKTSIINEQSASSIKHGELNSTYHTDHTIHFSKRQPRRKINRLLPSPDPHLPPTPHKSPPPSPARHSRSKSTSFRSILTPRLSGQLNINCFGLQQKIGCGSYSQVYRAVQKRTGLLCSLKIMSKQKIRQLGIQENITRQIKIQSFIQHPYITQLYGCFHDPENLYLIGELATDCNLHTLLKDKQARGERLKHTQIQQIIGQVSQSIHCLHEKNIIHRDVKPQNILITFGEVIKLCDFGWSVHNPLHQLRSTFCGTPLYLAPEIIKQSEYDEAVDIWAIGVIAYELFTNTIPFKIKSIKDLKKIVTEEVSFVGINSPVAVSFMQEALIKDKEERKTMRQLMKHPFLQDYFNRKNRPLL